MKRIPFLTLAASVACLAAETPPRPETTAATGFRQTSPRPQPPPEIRALVEKTGRFALHDFDADGWDDLWGIIHGRSKDGRNFAEHIKLRPEDDADGDGVSNWMEMLDFRNPWAVDKPAPPRTPEQVRAARKAAAEAARARDSQAVSRFQKLLEDRGVLERGPEPAPAVPVEDASGETPFSADPGEAWPLMTCGTGNGPAILFSERLTDGRFLLAWEGEPDRLYDVEWSGDLETWHLAEAGLPVIGGVGTWSQFSSAPRRFYRVTESRDIPSTAPGDPSGGDGVTTFGATLAPVMADGAPSHYLVTVNLPSGAEPSRVYLVIDGEPHSVCEPTGANDVFMGRLRWTHLLEGSHTAQARVAVDAETTAVLEPSFHAVLASPLTTFTLERRHIAVGFRVSEDRIAPDDPDLPPVTGIAVDIPGDPQGAGSVRIHDENDHLIREWTWGLDAYPLVFRQYWDGTDSSGAPVPGGRYRVELEFGGAGYQGEPIYIAAGGRSWSALCLMESMGAVGPAANWPTHFRPSWAPYYTSTGGAATPNAWGPWEHLISAAVITDELRGRVKDVFGLGKTGKWKVKYWRSGSRFSDPIPNPIDAFIAGNNPFNSYDMGFFVGHGVACLGGTRETPGGTIVRPPASYYPLVRDRDTGETHWVCSATAPKYGATGKLKWMFLFTCNSLSTEEGNAIYDVCKANNTLPFGNGLRVLCGYTSKIILERKMGGLLSEGLWKKVEGGEFRDGTVVNAWGHVWNKSSNRPKGKRARAVYWPECELDRIYGVDDPHMPALQPHASQAELEKTDFP